MQLSSSRTKVAPAVYTIGYQGSSLEAFFGKLQENEIKVIADVRSGPWSRKKDFNKSPLRRRCEKLEIEYCGVPELGVPAADRTRAYSLEDRTLLLKLYRKRVLQSERDVLMLLIEKVIQKPTALLCMEADPDRCHRSVLAEIISEICDLLVSHLR